MNVIPLLILVTSASIYYSYNSYNSYNSNDDIPLGKTKDGLIVYRVTEKRQCVEFIRRYLALTKGLAFHDVRDANELLHLKSLYKTSNPSKTYKTSFYRRPNVPRKGDIIFMNISKWGHVGVVVNVNNTVDIVSQNSDDQKWYQDKNNKDNEGYTERMSLSNPLILGWWRVDEKMENVEHPTPANS
jgi:surface antigen